MNLEWQTGKVVRIIDETHNTRRFFIEIPGLDRFDFKPGQFVTLDLPIHEKKINAGEVIPLLLGLTEPMCLNY
jgi:ferredoxin-NADP reductase